MYLLTTVTHHCITQVYINFYLVYDVFYSDEPTTVYWTRMYLIFLLFSIWCNIFCSLFIQCMTHCITQMYSDFYSVYDTSTEMRQFFFFFFLISDFFSSFLQFLYYYVPLYSFCVFDIFPGNKTIYMVTFLPIFIIITPIIVSVKCTPIST